MTKKLALKRLTAWDLSFFEWHFKSNQGFDRKAINLNANVFRDVFYPSLDLATRERPHRIAIDLNVSGPAGAEPLNLHRGIVKGKTVRSWCLDGDLIGNPEHQPQRFNMLEPGDLALLGFEGELVPTVVDLVLVSGKAEEDRSFFQQLEDALGEERMIAISAKKLRTFCETSSPASSHHAAWQLTSDDVIAQDGMRETKRQSEEVGHFGEVLVDFFLSSRAAKEIDVTDYEWVSGEDAVAPHDFRIRCRGSWGRLEVKSTGKEFGYPYFLSRGELKDMAEGIEFYRIARVYEVTNEGAKMRISEDLRELGKAVLESSSALPPEVKLEKVTITPDEKLFDSEISLSVPDWDEH